MIRLTLVLEATVGGTRRHLRDVVQALPVERFAVHVVGSVLRDPTYRDELREYERLGHRITTLPMTRAPDPVRDPLCIRRLAVILRQAPCDVLHLHSAKAGWLGRLAAWRNPCRVIYTPHAFPFQQEAPWPLPRMYAAAERLVARRTDLLLAVSEAEAELAVSTGLMPAGRVRSLPNAIDIGRLPPTQTRSAGPSTGLTIGFLGELRRQKDPLVFVRAVCRLASRFPEVRFLMPAHGALAGRVRQELRRAGVERRVELRDAESAFLEYMAELDLGVLPSRWEGLPYTLLEALAMGLPVVVSDIPPLARLAMRLDDRLVARKGDDGHLAQVLERWIGLPAEVVSRVGDAGRRVVAGDHTIGRWNQTLRTIYEQVSGGTKGPAVSS